MSCIHDEILRAHLDGELPASERGSVGEHLAACADCHTRFEKLRAEARRTEKLFAILAPAAEDSAINPGEAYAQFRNSVGTVDEPTASWITRLFAPRWRPAWGFAALAITVAILVSVNPVRIWAQQVLAMLRVEKIQVVTIDPATLMSSSAPGSRPYKLMNQFISDSVVVTIDPGKPAIVSDVAQAAELTGQPIRIIGNLAAPTSVEVNGETAFQMTIDRDRIAALLEEVGRSDIQIPESANGALVAVHIPKTVVSSYGDCPLQQRALGSNPQSRAEAMAARKMDRLASAKDTNCTYLIQAQSPTVSVPPNLDMAGIAEAALELVGMSPAEARSFCQTVDWSSTLVVPIPSNSSSSETVAVDGVEGSLITQTFSEGNRYSLLWVKDGVIYSLAGHGGSSEALSLAASLR
jgi:Putative zinc-finger